MQRTDDPAERARLEARSSAIKWILVSCFDYQGHGIVDSIWVTPAADVADRDRRPLVEIAAEASSVSRSKSRSTDRRRSRSARSGG
uniref:hypothetical protein n=1 Tax=Halorarum halophilum TaxID=2743090 RepID=UPI001FE63D26|nr:hypothetical protein [Halobaculum halophilum]